MNPLPSKLYILTNITCVVNKLLTQKAMYSLSELYQDYWELWEHAGRLLEYRPKSKSSHHRTSTIKDSLENMHMAQRHISQFYPNLYTENLNVTSEEINMFLDFLTMPHISGIQKEILETPLSIDEVTLALRDMNNNKSLGSDEFPVEFCKKLKDILLPQSLNVYNVSKNQGTLPSTLCEAVIFVIPKPGKESINCSNHTPISLMNVHAKIQAKTLSQRLEQVILKLIHKK